MAIAAKPCTLPPHPGHFRPSPLGLIQYISVISVPVTGIDRVQASYTFLLCTYTCVACIHHRGDMPVPRWHGADGAHSETAARPCRRFRGGTCRGSTMTRHSHRATSELRPKEHKRIHIRPRLVAAGQRSLGRKTRNEAGQIAMCAPSHPVARCATTGASSSRVGFRVCVGNLGTSFAPVIILYLKDCS